MANAIRYCTRCVMPATKPGLKLDAEGVCDGCRRMEARAEVDWQTRKRELLQLLERYRSKDGSNYDCLIPVSGGKDSTYQVLKVREFGLNPLCVTATTDMLTPIGRRNIENIKRLGVDYIEITTNPVVRRKLNRMALEQVGDISWPEHATIFTIPVRVAVQMNVPLIVWGENSYDEGGGPAAAAESKTLTREFLFNFGGLLGLAPGHFIGRDGIEARDMIQYTYPSDAELQRVGVTGVFLGYYLPWDGYTNALIAQAHGFEVYPRAVEGSIVNYENLDNAQMRIHDYFKFLKFGYARATDHACAHIRRGRLTREDGIKLAALHDGKFPWTYLGVRLEDVLNDVGITVDEFVAVCDRVTNKSLFRCDESGALIKDEQGNLTKINYDNVPACGAGVGQD